MTETRITNQHNGSPAPTGRVTNNNRRIRRGIWLTLLLVVPLGAAACGSGSNSPNVANLGSTASTTTSSATSGTSLEKFAACMRSHGVPQFPDPINNGTSLRLRVGPGRRRPAVPAVPIRAGRVQRPGADGFGGELGAYRSHPPSSSTTSKQPPAFARTASPASLTPRSQTATSSSCCLPALNTNSPRAQAAIATCRKLIPAGLPYSN